MTSPSSSLLQKELEDLFLKGGGEDVYENPHLDFLSSLHEDGSCCMKALVVIVAVVLRGLCHCNGVKKCGKTSSFSALTSLCLLGRLRFAAYFFPLSLRDSNKTEEGGGRKKFKFSPVNNPTMEKKEKEFSTMNGAI